MGAGLHQHPAVIHKAANADFNNYHYHRVYAASEKDVVINGETVTMTKGLVLPVNVRKNQISATSGGTLTDIYVLGNPSAIPDSIGYDKPK